MNILFANHTKMVNDSGGMAKVTCAFANEMAKRGHTVSLIYSDEERGEFFYPIDPSIKLYNIREDENGNIAKFPLYLKAYREILRVFDKRAARTVNSHFGKKFITNLRRCIEEVRPDIIVSHNLGTSRNLLCDLDTQISVITMAHGDTGDYFKVYPVENLPALPKSALCQVLMHAYEKSLLDHMPDLKTIVIGNAIPQFDFVADLQAEKERKKVIYVARLSKGHKRPHLLIEAFIKIAQKHPDWDLDLWGAKDNKYYYKELESLIKKAHLEDRIVLKGTTKDVPFELRKADIFGFPSAVEGFGMALGEAMSVGLPSVAYKSCIAANELLENNKTGLLCEDGVEPLAEALDKLMSDKDLRIQMGREAKIAMQEFAPEKIWDKWEETIKLVLTKSKS